MKKQLSIECPPAKHNYRQGVDRVLQQQQLQDLIKSGAHVKSGKPKSGLSKTDAPLFGERKADTEQKKLF
jgi:hypothetical protein